MFNFEFKLQQQSLYVRCRYFRFLYLFRYLFRSCGNLHRSKCLDWAKEHFSCILRVLLVYVKHAFPSNEDTDFVNSTFRLWISVLLGSQNRQHGAELFLTQLFVKKRRRKPTFWGGFVFSILCPLPHFLLQLLFKLSVYVKDWAATCSTGLLGAICRAGFSSVSTAALKDCTLFAQNRGKGGSKSVLWLHVQTCFRQVTIKLTLDVLSPLTILITHEQCLAMWKGYLVYVTNFCFPCMEKPFGPQCCCLRSVCAVVPSVCLLLHQGLDEWVYWL